MAGDGASGAGRWMRLLLLIVAGVLIAIAVSAVLRGRDWAAAEHQRNYRELEIVGRAIEGWPKTIEAMARSNFKFGRLEKAGLLSEDFGALAVAPFTHPDLGAFKIDYAVRDCVATPAEPCAAQHSAAVLEADSQLKIQGELALRDLAAGDDNSLTSAAVVDRALSQQDPLPKLADPGIVHETSLLKYWTALSLERVANLADSAPDFETAFVVDDGGRVVATLGGRPLPVSSIEDIIASNGDIGSLFLTSARVIASKGAVTGDEPPVETKLNLRANAEPVSVKIAGDSYIVYVRPLNFPAPWASSCGDGGRATNAANAVTRCKLVGLVRQKDVYARSLSLSPDLLTLAAIFLTLAVALVPVMKLRFLGPAGHLTPVEVIAAIFGIIAAFGLVILAGMLLISALLAHAQSRQQVHDTAAAMARQFENEFKAILNQPIDYAMLAKKPPATDGIVRRFSNPICNAAPAKPAVGGPAEPAPAPQFLYIEAFGGAGPWVWPLRETAALTNAAGTIYGDTTSYSNRCASGSRFDLGQRRYFRNAVDNKNTMPFRLDSKFPQMRASFAEKGFMFFDYYAVESVRSQADANDKVLVAIPFSWLDVSLDSNAKDVPEKLKSGVLFQSMTMRSFLSPVLPGSAEFIVIDTSDAEWPYIFGSNTRRIGIDRLRGSFGTEDADDAIMQALRAAHRSDETPGDTKTGKVTKPAGAENFAFEAVFEGKQQQFVARGLKGTPWVLLVHQPMREVDVALASTASFAAAAWFGLALLGALVFALAWTIWGKASWLWLWPRPEHGERALHAAHRIAAMLLIALVVLLLPAANWVVFKVWLAVLIPAIASLIAWRQVGRAPATRQGAILMPIDERGYRWLYVALFLSFGALPMLVLWNDAARVTRARLANAEIIHLETAWKANRDATLGILKLVNLDKVKALDLGASITNWPTITKKLPEWPEGFKTVGAPGLDPDLAPGAGYEVIGFSDWLHAWAGVGIPAPVRSCGNAADAASDARFCVARKSGEIGLVHPNVRLRASFSGVSVPGLIGGLLGMGVLLLLLRMSIGAMVRSLFGFGTPLEAVTYPTLSRSRGKLELPERAVVLNGPLALQLELLGVNDALDLGQTEAQRGPDGGSFASHRDRLAQGQTVVAIGLEMALRDPALAEAALVTLEELSLVIDRRRRADGVVLGRLVVLTDLSPLDRILQAYEREQSGHSGEQPQISRQQQLRWSRLFEDFTTVIFRPTPKFRWNPRIEARCRAQLVGHSASHGVRNEAEGVLQLVRETRFLPEVVLNSLIDPRQVPSAATWAKLFATTYPISMTQYGRLYWRPVWAWAQSVSPATREAAIDYLRGTLIEHYQHLWVASSYAERVILDNLARGRIVSIESALALRSLIRRGLVVLDPEPRLINASFGAFVRQAERPEAMAKYRSQQGKSGWDKAALPIAIVLPGAILGLAALALMAGQSFTTVFPVILGVGPALLSTFGGRKSS